MEERHLPKRMCRLLFIFFLLSGIGRMVIAQTETSTGALVALTLEGARDLIEDGRYPEAEALLRRLLEETEERHGAHSLEAARVLDALVDSLIRGRKAEDPESKQLAERALDLKQTALGPEHPEVAASLDSLGLALQAMGDHGGAKPLHERALAIREKAFGPQHPEVADSLNSLGLLLQATGEYPEAKPLFERSLAIYEKSLGPQHPEVAGSLNNLANLYTVIGDYAMARPLLERALAIREEAFGSEHPAVAESLHNLASVRYAVGDVKAGEGVFGLRRAFEVAGVDTLIMSLWAVEDVSAREWMTGLYRARLVDGKDTIECVRDASLSVLKRRREEGLSSHPFYWGGFVAAGNWN